VSCGAAISVRPGSSRQNRVSLPYGARRHTNATRRGNWIPPALRGSRSRGELQRSDFGPSEVVANRKPP
jgi:hypothetical protein